MSSPLGTQALAGHSIIPMCCAKNGMFAVVIKIVDEIKKMKVMLDINNILFPRKCSGNN